MTVSLTRVQTKMVLTRTVGQLTDDEIDYQLSRASSQVAAWVTESTATGKAQVTFSQFYEDELARLQVQIYALSDRMSAAADSSVEFSEASPFGSQQATQRRFGIPTNLHKHWEVLKKERDTLLNKLGISTIIETLPASTTTCRRAEEYTVGSYENCDPGVDWQGRNDESPWNDR